MKYTFSLHMILHRCKRVAFSQRFKYRAQSMFFLFLMKYRFVVTKVLGFTLVLSLASRAKLSFEDELGR